ncbi:hypothetical protein E1263_37905 [Kribbella antibiotica]|uniref:Uncharacterized protein n=1 Tax=Kribbella antibiotica TaxID=190195 RepID=A0A4R4YLE3_9ACTN|nr:hypothetical protein [Kribbella antibiotica]TDD45783.1 hypothetical protein E1263_37905 [Kribbella antibiotica]
MEISHYEVTVRYQLMPECLSGVTTILATSTERLAKFELRFLLAVSAVKVNNESAAFTAENGVLTVTPKDAIEPGADLLVVVSYYDSPANHSDGWGWEHTPGGAVVVSSPQWLYPSADGRTEWATQSVQIVVPKGLKVEPVAADSDRLVEQLC